ncbi:MAG: GntR family transcriptional regulator [Lentisphaeria bacterium]
MPPLVYGNRVPLYRQIAQALRQRVRTGVYAAGRPLPTLRALAVEYGVSVYAIPKAIYELEKEQVVVTQHGKGITVMAEKPCDQAAILAAMLLSSLNSARGAARRTACCGNLRQVGGGHGPVCAGLQRRLSAMVCQL